MREKAGLPKPASQRPETTIIGPRPVDRVPQRPSSPEANAPAPAPPQPVKPKATKRWIDGVPVIITVPAALSVTIMILVLAVSLLYFVPDGPPNHLYLSVSLALTGIPFVFGLVLFWWMRCDFRYAIPLGMVVGIAFNIIILAIDALVSGTPLRLPSIDHWRQHADFGSMIAFATVLGNASTAMIAFATVLGNASTELVTRRQQMEIKRMQLLIGIAVAMLAGVLYIGWNLSVF